MSNVPAGLRYTKEHEWAQIDGDVAKIGITDFAQSELGDVVLVLLPAVGDRVEHFEPMGEVESVKAVSELFSPLSGEVVEVNSALAINPELVNDSPYEEGWMLKVNISNPSELDNLMSAADYERFLETADAH